MSEKLIRLSNLSMTFEDGETILDGINLYINNKEFLTLLGPSGCGKTTTLRIIGGFLTPTSGDVFFNGQRINDVPSYKRKINTVFQRYALFPHLDVYDNIAFGLRLAKLSEEEIDERVTEMLEIVSLKGFENRRVTSLSGGQQQRVAIARALVNRPQVLLLDEPLGALDLRLRKDMQNELKNIQQRMGITFIYVTHDQEEALTMSDVVVVMNDGVIQQIAPPKKIYDEPANAFVANFIGESNILSGVMEKDFTINFLGQSIECVDKGFQKNEHVDIVIRPEDIKIYPENTEKGQFAGTVLQTVFKGTYYEVEVECSGYEFTVQNTKEFLPGQNVRLGIAPDSIHIMKKLRTINQFEGEISDEENVWFCEADFPVASTQGFEKKDKVKVLVPFDAVELTDYEDDGTIGGNVSQTLYKGTYYQVQVYTDTDEDFYVDTADEWDIGDRVGIKVDPNKIILQPAEEDEDEEEKD